MEVIGNLEMSVNSDMSELYDQNSHTAGDGSEVKLEPIDIPDDVELGLAQTNQSLPSVGSKKNDSRTTSHDKLKQREVDDSGKYLFFGWLVTHYKCQRDDDPVERIDLDCLYSEYTEQTGERCLDRNLISNYVITAFPSMTYSTGRSLLYYPIRKLKSWTGDVRITLPPKCSSSCDGLAHIFKVRTAHIIDGELFFYHIIWSTEKICMKYGRRTIELVRQDPPKYWVALTQDTFDGILRFCQNIAVCRGFQTCEDDLNDSNLLVECWSNISDLDNFDCRSRDKHCEVLHVRARDPTSNERMCRQCTTALKCLKLAQKCPRVPVGQSRAVNVQD